MVKRTFIFTEIPAQVTGGEPRYVFRGRYLSERGFHTAMGLVKSYTRTKKMFTGWGADNLLNELLKPDNTDKVQEDE
jgi:hypothetical protein